METDPLDAQSALDAAAAAERRTAQIVTSTPWYAPWYGITCAGFPVAIALIATRTPIGFAVLVLCLASLALLVATYNKATGVWPSGRGMLTHTIVGVVVLFGMAITGYVVASTYGVGWWLVAIALVTAVTMTLLSRAYDAAYARKHGV